MKTSRRQFLTAMGLGSGALLSGRGIMIAGREIAAVASVRPGAEEPGKVQKDFISILNPKTLAADRVPAERIYIGPFYKPCVARLPSDELRLIAEDTQPNPNLHVDNLHPILRSRDGGRTWEKFAVADLTSGEPYLTALKDGTLFMTGDIWIRSQGKPGRNLAHYLHRSEDGGLSWTNPETASMPMREKDIRVTTRNVLRLRDGSLVVGLGDMNVYDPGMGPKTFFWRSFDGGRTWSERYPAEFEDFRKGYKYDLFEEAHLWEARSGKILALVRVSPDYAPFPGRPTPSLPRSMKYEDMRDNWRPGQAPYTGPDGEYCDDFDRLIVYGSADLGRTWKKVRDFGDYGEGHYPSILRLQDGRLLLTFTLRAGKDQLGLQAIPATETPDGFDFDLEHDRIVIEAKTPMNMVSGGGYGPTVQLKDGTLVTSYSYRIAKTNRGLRSEVVRWRLPKARM